MDKERIERIIQIYKDLNNSIINNDDSKYIDLINKFCDSLGYKNEIPVYYENTSLISEKNDKLWEIKKSIVDNTNDELRAIICILDFYHENNNSEYILNKMIDFNYMIKPLDYLNNRDKLSYIEQINNVLNNNGKYKEVYGTEQLEKYGALLNDLENNIKNEINIEKEKIAEENRVQRAKEHDEETLDEMANQNIDIDEFSKLFSNLVDDSSKEIAIDNYLIKAMRNKPLRIMEMFTFITNIDDDLRKKAISATFENPDFEKIYIDIDEKNPSLGIMRILDYYKNYSYAYIEDKKYLLKYYYDNGMFDEIKTLQHNQSFDMELSYYLIELMGYSDKQKQYLEQLMAINTEMIKMDYRYLADKYIDNFSPYEMYLLDASNIKLENIKETEIKALKVGLRSFPNNNSYTEYVANYVKGLKSCNELLNNIDIDSLSDEALKNLIIVVSSGNAMNAKNADDLDNLDLCIDKATRLNDNEGNIDKIKESIILKEYGMGYETAKDIYLQFPEFINHDERFNNMETVMESNDINQLREIYNGIGKKRDLIDTVQLQKSFISYYEKEFNDNLIGIDKMQQIDEKFNGIPIYDAGDNFKIIVSASSPFMQEKTPDNYKDDWNRNNSSSSIFCGSLISNEMLGMCTSKRGIYYGFDHIEDGTLVNMGISDIQSSSTQLSAGRNGITRYLTSQDLINNTGYPDRGRPEDNYNEVNIKRLSNGKRIQPSYLLVFKYNNKIPNLNPSVNASRDFDNIPIVLIDIDRIIEKGKNEINALTNIYLNDPTLKNLENVWNKFHNYSVTYSRWFGKQFHKEVNLPNEIVDNNIYDENYRLYTINPIAFENIKTKAEEEVKTL